MNGRNEVLEISLQSFYELFGCYPLKYKQYFQFATENQYMAECEADDEITYDAIPDINANPEKYEVLKWNLQVNAVSIFTSLCFYETVNE